MKKTAVLGFVAGVVAALTWAGPAAAQTFVAHLAGANEVPPVDTAAVGQATVMVTRNNVLHTVSVGNIADVIASHIHCAPAGVNGPVGITLFFDFANPVGSGNLARGPLPDPDAGNGCGWATLDDAIAAIEAGNAYVNVHTFPANPGGEVRGQLR